MPLDYSRILRPTESPIDKALKLMQVSSAMRQGQQKQNVAGVSQEKYALEAAKAKGAEMKIERMQQFQKKAFDLSQKEDVGADDYIQLMTEFPESASGIKQAFGAFDETQKTNARKNILPYFTALQLGDVEGAKNILNEQKKAAEASGLEKESTALDIKLKALDINPGSVKAGAAMALAELIPGNEFANLFTKIEDEKRKRATHPEELKKKKLETIKAAKDIGLTGSQILRINKNTEDFSSDVALALVELEGMKSGKISDDPEKIFDVEQKLRKEYVANNKDYLDMERSLARIRSTVPTGPGDIALITSFMKLLDPGSVVRESETALALRAAGKVEELKAWIPRIEAGEQLSPKTRKKFIEQAEKVFKSAMAIEKRQRKTLENVVKDMGLNPDHVFFPEPQEETPALQKEEEKETIIPPTAEELQTLE